MAQESSSDGLAPYRELVRTIFEDWDPPHVPMTTISTVVDPHTSGAGHGVYLSSYMGPYNTVELQRLDIRRVVNVGGENRFNEPYRLPQGIAYLYLPVLDEPSFVLDPHLARALDFMAGDAPANTLVHCQLGVSRSVTVVTAFLIKHRNMTLEAACRTVKQGRPIAMPNEGFQDALVRFAHAHGKL